MTERVATTPLSLENQLPVGRVSLSRDMQVSKEYIGTVLSLEQVTRILTSAKAISEGHSTENRTRNKLALLGMQTVPIDVVYQLGVDVEGLTTEQITSAIRLLHPSVEDMLADIKNTKATPTYESSYAMYGCIVDESIARIASGLNIKRNIKRELLDHYPIVILEDWNLNRTVPRIKGIFKKRVVYEDVSVDKIAEIRIEYHSFKIDCHNPLAIKIISDITSKLRGVYPEIYSKYSYNPLKR